MFVQFTDNEGKRHFVNPNLVIRVTEHNAQLSTIIFDGDMIKVPGTVDEVIGQLNGATDQDS